MKITLKLFSLAKDLAGFDERIVDVARGGLAEDILTLLVRQNPKFLDWRRSIRLAVNMEYVDEKYPLKDGDEVAVIPPVSGG